LAHSAPLRSDYDRLRNSRNDSTENLTYEQCTERGLQAVSRASPLQPSIDTEMNKASSTQCRFGRSGL
jgi:hypothetical protein